MRVIERNIISALRNQENLHKGNTSVENYPLDGQVSIMHCDLVGEVYLHGNLIARFNPAINELTIYDAGWQSVTTKSRLNALLSEFATGYGIVQHKHKWYLVSRDQTWLEWDSLATFRAGKLVASYK